MNFKPKYLHVANGYDTGHGADFLNVFMLLCVCVCVCVCLSVGRLVGRIESCKL